VALDIPSGLAVSFAVTGTTAASRLLSTPSVSLDAARARGLGDGTVAGRFVERTVSISTDAARQALNQSLYAGTAIRSALRELSGLARLAENGGLVSNSTSLLSADGTRVSRGNIQTQINRALGLIDDLVSASASGSANFINGSGPSIRVQTSSFGGAINILPQGLDSRSLGLSGLDVSTSADAREARARLDVAIQAAGNRLDRLSQLQTALGQGSPFNQAVVSATADISGALPVGAFVNLSA